MKKYIVEFVGTFFLVFSVGCCVVGATPGIIAPIAIGATLTAMIYAGGYISGAHYNPAVSVATYFCDTLSRSDLVPYFISQLLGAILASAVVLVLKSGSTPVILSVNVGTALIVEFLFTFALAYVVLHVATTEKNAGNSYYGLAIGLVVVAGAFTVGGISGGAFNPAVTIALSVMGILSWNLAILYISVQILAGMIASVVFLKTQD